MMDTTKFYDGQLLKLIGWDGDREYVSVDQPAIVQLHISIELIGVWVVATHVTGQVFKYNLSGCDHVELLTT